MIQINLMLFYLSHEIKITNILIILLKGETLLQQLVNLIKLSLYSELLLKRVNLANFQECTSQLIHDLIQKHSKRYNIKC